MGDSLGASGRVQALKACDADGDWPAGPSLYAGGRFRWPGMTTVSRVARWDGTTWENISGTGSGDTWILRTWDPDGDGPLGERLVAGGSFTSMGGVNASRIAVWDGVAWSPLGPGLSADVYALTSWDPDGAGPLPRRLVAGGAFSRTGSTTLIGLAMWDGAQWQPIGPGLSNGRVYGLCTWDPDGDGPEPENLFVGGTFTSIGGTLARYVARWDGATWRDVGGSVTSGVDIQSLTTWDSDGDGPASELLYASGTFREVGGVPAEGAATWDGATWRAVSTWQGNDVVEWEPWTDDSIEGAREQLYACGALPLTSDYSSSYIARWDGERWASIGSGLNELPSCAMEWREGETSSLLIGGSFSHIDSETAQSLVRWDGTAWSPFGDPLTGGAVACLENWDPDGDGPQPPLVVAGGTFVASGPQTLKSVAAWNGENWLPFGAGLNPSLAALHSWDSDGAGPSPPVLIAGGSFQQVDGQSCVERNGVGQPGRRVERRGRRRAGVGL